MNTKMLNVAIELVDALYDHGNQNAVICGGFARDLHFGLDAKDADIMLLDPRFVDPVVVEDVLWSAARSIYSHSAVVRHQGEEYMDDRIEGVWQVLFNGFTIDVLWYNPKRYNMATGEEACEAFDFNINQFYVDEYGVVQFGGMDYDHPSAIKALVQFEPVSYQRLARMEAKWDLIKDKI